MTHMPSPTYADLKLTVTLLSLINVKLSESLSSVIPSPFSQFTAVLKEWERASEREREENCEICQGFPGVWLFLSTPVPRWLGSRAGGWVLVLFFLHAHYLSCMSGAWLERSIRYGAFEPSMTGQFISNSPADHVA